MRARSAGDRERGPAVASALLVLTLCLCGRGARADEAPRESLHESPDESPDQAPDPSAGASQDAPQQSTEDGPPKRPVPDYDGRPEPSPTVGDVLLWVPRVAFYPLYLVSEYGVRRPFGTLVTTAERDHWLAWLVDFFTFGEEQKIGLVPTAYLEFNLEPSLGVYFFADDAFTDDNDVRVFAAAWPADWLSLRVLDRFSNADDTMWLSVRASLLLRPDYQYHGLGPDSRQQDRSRYAGSTHEAALRFEGMPWRTSHVIWEMGPRRRTFSTRTDFQRPNLQQAIDDPDNRIDALPPGFSSGYTVWRNAVRLVLDSRRPFPASASGVRAEVRGEHAFDLDAPVERRWVRYGGSLGGFLDIHNQRTLVLTAEVEMADPLAGQIPFTELPTLGGAPPMQGFQQGRMIDRSYAAAVLEYRWPVWMWADFVLHYAVGNVFGPQLRGFEPGKLRASFGVGLRAARISSPDHSINVLVALGSQTFDGGAKIEEFRFVVGAVSGF
ncbi:MAG: BamA/TamA family outer membrane protein [Myxococcales bacterium]|jgi:hypothetical protein